MKLEKPIQIDSHILSKLEFVKTEMLFISNGGRFIILKSFETEQREEEVIIKHIFSKNTINKINRLYITDIELWGYDSDNSYWGTFGESAISLFLFYYDLTTLRSNYEKMKKEPLKKLGFEITKINN